MSGWPIVPPVNESPPPPALPWKQAIFILMCDQGEHPVILTAVGIQNPFSHPT